jgi:hypothetical protein
MYVYTINSFQIIFVEWSLLHLFSRYEIHLMTMETLDGMNTENKLVQITVVQITDLDKCGQIQL